MRYLADSNVLSEPTKPQPEWGVVEWLKRKQSKIVVNPIILGELEYGIPLLPGGEKRRKLEKWFQVGL